MPRRVLVVEDDRIQQSVLQSALQKRGYEVEIAADGVSAVRKVLFGDFDLALIDYRLPGIDGLASARLMRDLLARAECPTLIAISMDTDALSERTVQSDVFDAILTKRIELASLLATIDSHLSSQAAQQASHAGAQAWRALGLDDAPAALVLPAPGKAQARMLRQHFDLSGQRAPDVVLLAGGADAAVAERSAGAHFALPFVALSAELAPQADAVFSATDPASWKAVAQVIADFRRRRRLLPGGVLGSTDSATRLLAYAFLSGKPLSPVGAFDSRLGVRYPGFFAEPDMVRDAEQLVARELMDRRFHDRIHVCGQCGSAHLKLRTECEACRSPRLHRAPVVRHLACGHRAPASAFRRGTNLACPGCREPVASLTAGCVAEGLAWACEECGRPNEKPARRLYCRECGTQADADADTLAGRDVFSYAVGSRGVEFLSLGAPASFSTPIFESPVLFYGLREALLRPEPVQFLAEIGYCPQARILTRRGPGALRALRRLFLDNLVGALGGRCEVFMDTERDYLLVRESPMALPEDLTPQLLRMCQEILVEPLYPDIRQIDPFLHRPAE